MPKLKPKPTPFHRRRAVTISPLVPKRGRTQLWAYGYADLAHLTDLTEGTLRNLVFKHKLDPGDLEQICRLWMRRQRRPSFRPSPTRPGQES